MVQGGHGGPADYQSGDRVSATQAAADYSSRGFRTHQATIRGHQVAALGLDLIFCQAVQAQRYGCQRKQMHLIVFRNP